MNSSLRDDLLRLGAGESSIQWLDPLDARTLDYVDLIPCESETGKITLHPEAVVQAHGRALAYVVHAGSLTRAPENERAALDRLRRNLACRGDGRYLVVWRPGEVELLPLDLRPEMPKPPASNHRFGTPTVPGDRSGGTARMG